MRSRAESAALGRRNKGAGDAFESWIDVQHEMAHRLGILACVEKTEPHARVLGGRVTYTSAGVADYCGTLCGNGKSLAVEAKSTSESRLYRSEVKSKQARHLDAVAAAGGLALLLVEFRVSDLGHLRYAVLWQEVPWSVARSAESVGAADDMLMEWSVRPGTCYLSKFHPGGPVVGSVGRKRVFPRE